MSVSGHGNGLAVWDRAGFEQHDAREINIGNAGEISSDAASKRRESGTSVSISAPRDGESPHAVEETYASAARHLVQLPRACFVYRISPWKGSCVLQGRRVTDFSKEVTNKQRLKKAKIAWVPLTMRSLLAGKGKQRSSVALARLHD
jgi:hypothetical protein